MPPLGSPAAHTKLWKQVSMMSGMSSSPGRVPGNAASTSCPPAPCLWRRPTSRARPLPPPAAAAGSGGSPAAPGVHGFFYMCPCEIDFKLYVFMYVQYVNCTCV